MFAVNVRSASQINCDGFIHTVHSSSVHPVRCERSFTLKQRDFIGFWTSVVIRTLWPRRIYPSYSAILTSTYTQPRFPKRHSSRSS